MSRAARLAAFAFALCCAAGAAEDRLIFPGARGPGQGKRIVLVSGDEEYRSEQMLPQLAAILSSRHGFDCTVLFAIDPAGSTVDPTYARNIPGLETLDTADLLVLFTRFRDLPDEQMKHFVDYVESRRPIVALRTATHAFDLKTSATYRRYSWNSKEWDGGFGRQVLGETWVSHHGRHAVQSSRAVAAPGQLRNPLLRGIPDGSLWVPTDVYTVRLPASVQPLLLGQVLSGMHATDPPVQGPQNDPMLPVAWTRSEPRRVFTTTMGSAQDFQNESFRRLLVNAVYWAAGLERRIPARARVDLVGSYDPLPFGFGGAAKNKKPEDYRPR